MPTRDDCAPSLCRPAFMWPQGEQLQAMDDALYALDGLKPASSLATQRESFAALTALLSTRRGRAALVADGVTQQVSD
eukprot:190732-Chlamydomonas_euryale.AAC.23